MLKFHKKRKHYLGKKSLLAILLIVVFGIGIYGYSGHAEDISLGAIGNGVVLTVVGWLFEIIIYPIGLLLTLVINVLLGIAKYNNFINEPPVIYGWSQIRDLSNMFFILILLVISFATILRIESYNIKRQLPKLIIMAILINFSKTICGIIIEFAQIIMMTFVNAVQGNGSGFVNLLGVEHFLNFVENNRFSDNVNLLSTAGGYFLALLFLIVSLIVIISFMGVLLMRMVMLWVYIVLSPLAYLLAAFPQGQGYASRWWSEFSKYVITGPILAFFLWLAMVSARSTANITGDDTCFGPWDIVCTGPFLQFVIGIGMLVGGLKITSEIGGIVGSAAAKGIGHLQTGKAIIKKAPGVAGAWGARKIAAKTGIEMRPSRIMGGIKESFKESEMKDNAMARAKAGGLLERGGLASWAGALGAGPDGANAFISGFANRKGFANAFRTLRNGPKKIEKENKRFEEEDKSLEKEIAELEKDPMVNQKKITAKKKERDNLRKEHKRKLANMAPPTAFDGRVAERTLINEEKKKASEFKTSDELLTHYKKAVNSGDKYRAIAIAEQLADNGDLNELLTEYGEETSAVGLHNFVQKNLVNKKKTNQQEALRFQNYLSDAAQKVGHWEMAKTVGVNMDGTLKSLITVDKNGKFDDSAHVASAYADMQKLDPQVRAKLGRLAFGGEDKNGNYQLSNLGKMIMANDAKAFVDHGKRIQANTAQNILSSDAYKNHRDELLKNYDAEYIQKIEEVLKESASETRIDFKKRVKELDSL